MKRYQCPYCGCALPHDKIYKHVQFECANRPKR